MFTRRTIIFLVFFCTLYFCIQRANGQNVSINSSGASPDASAMLDVASTSKGMLFPRVALTISTSNAPIGTGIANSLLVYNTATINDVTPGYYYWDANNSQWVRLATGPGITGPTGSQGIQGATGATGAVGPTGTVSLPTVSYVENNAVGNTTSQSAVTRVSLTLAAGTYLLTACCEVYNDTYLDNVNVVFTDNNSTDLGSSEPFAAANPYGNWSMTRKVTIATSTTYYLQWYVHPGSGGTAYIKNARISAIGCQ